MLQETAELLAELRDPRFTPSLAMQLEAMITHLEDRRLTGFGDPAAAMWWLAEQVREDRLRYHIEVNELQLLSTRTICRAMGTRLPRPPKWTYLAVVSYVSRLWDERLPAGEPRTPLRTPPPKLHPALQRVMDALIKEIW